MKPNNKLTPLALVILNTLLDRVGKQQEATVMLEIENLVIQHYDKPHTEISYAEASAYLEANEQMLYDRFIK